VAAADVKVASVEAVTWPDGSLGHPEPGMDYTMALVPGYRVVLQAGDKFHEYHTDRSGARIVYCGPPATPPKPGGKQGPAGTRATGGASGPPPAKVFLLYLEPIPEEPNRNGRLMAREPGAADSTARMVLDRCTDFAVSEFGAVLAKRRTSKSTHELVMLLPGAEPSVVLQAFDFEAFTWLRPAGGYFFLAAPDPGGSFRMYLGDPGGPPTPLDWAPRLKRPRDVRVQAHWNLVTVTVPAGDSGEKDVIILDRYARRVVDSFRAMDVISAVLPALPAEPAAP
jgi:hypothetical protein